MGNIAITGAAGFIGSHLAKALIENGNRVIGIDNFDPFYSNLVKRKNIAKIQNLENFEFYELDVRSENFTLALSNVEIDTIIHLSARAGVRPSFLFPRSYIHHDIEATVNVLESCVKLNISNLLFGSSSSVYGNSDELPYKESLKLDKPISPYAASKLSCELFNYVYHSQYGLNISNLRFFTVYGPRQRPEMGIHKFTDKIFHDQPIEMYGDGNSSRDYTYIDDIVDGICLALKKINGYNTYNLGNNDPVKLKYLIELIGESLNKKPVIIPKPSQPGDVDHTLADLTLAKEELGYQPKISIQEGIKRFVDWYLNEKLND